MRKEEIQIVNRGHGSRIRTYDEFEMALVSHEPNSEIYAEIEESEAKISKDHGSEKKLIAVS